MTFQKTLKVASFRAALLTNEYKKMLKNGKIKEAIQYLGIHLLENPGDMPEESFLDALALTVHDKWLKEYAVNVSIKDITKAIKSARTPS